MKTSALPIFCGAALAAMSTAGLSHWWSVRQFVAAVDSGLPVSTQPDNPPSVAPDETPDSSMSRSLFASKSKTNKPDAPAATAADAPAKMEFYEALLTKMDSLQTQNRDLLDQLAETNRDVMKLEFRVDTHSESFRPLPVAEDRPFTSIAGPGVLPPRAAPVSLPTFD